jgi:hypothetical protein
VTLLLSCARERERERVCLSVCVCFMCVSDTVYVLSSFCCVPLVAGYCFVDVIRYSAVNGVTCYQVLYVTVTVLVRI